jgi:hypothetical protein
MRCCRGFSLANGDGAPIGARPPNGDMRRGLEPCCCLRSCCLRSRHPRSPQRLSGPNGSTRTAAAYYDPNQIQVQVHFSTAYEGNLHLYAVDWDSTARRETITAGGQSASLTAGNFSQGAPGVSFPIDVVAGATVSVTVNRTAGANAVLSGIFLGDVGSPPTMPVSTAPQGSWVGSYGSVGYGLAGWNDSTDLASPPNATLTLERGTRYRWAPVTTDVRVLQSPDKSTRAATTYYDANQVLVKLSFTAAYSGNLALYAVDWDKRNRRETITVNGQTSALSADFSQGAWLSFPINVPAGSAANITVDRTAGVNVVLSGIFLG